MPIKAHLALLAPLVVSPAFADVKESVDWIAPRMASFADATQSLASAGAACEPEAMKAAYGTAFDAWMAIQHLRLGPSEEAGRAQAIYFWPDPKGMGIKAQKALLAGDPARLAPAAFADQSVAARGLMATERLLYPETPWAADTCPLIAATTADLARVGGELAAGWQSYGPLMVTAGAEGNTAYMTPDEARQALYTQIATALEGLVDNRLNRPLGTFDAPQPTRAEARASGRSLRNVTLELEALRGFTASLTEGLATPAPLTLAAFDTAINQAQTLEDPVFAGVSDPSKRLKVEILAQSVTRIRELVLSELGPALGVKIGFNSADGD